MTSLFVANSSPLIVFERIAQLNLLRTLLGRAFIPPAVQREVFGPAPLPDWIEMRELKQPLAPRLVAARLGAGEREAIALALEMNATAVVLDDLAARRLAQSLGFSVVGSAGLLLRAKTNRLIASVRPLLEKMQVEDFRIADKVLEEILRAASEL